MKRYKLYCNIFSHNDLSYNKAALDGNTVNVVTPFNNPKISNEINDYVKS